LRRVRETITNSHKLIKINNRLSGAFKKQPGEQRNKHSVVLKLFAHYPTLTNQIILHTKAAKQKTYSEEER